MDLIAGNKDLEQLNQQLNDPQLLHDYKQPLDNYRPSLPPRILGTILVTCGNIVYGEKPSYLKFRAVEVIARVPYHSWSSAAYTLLTFFYANEQKALELSKVERFARIAQDNETMHVIVISQLADKEQPAGIIRHTLIPMFFAFFYFGASYFMFLLRPRWSYELNYLFESHAFDQYNRFLESRGEELHNKPILSDFLSHYGRYPINQYDFFLSIRNDEIIHRNQSIHEIDTEVDDLHVKRIKFFLASAFCLLALWSFYCLLK